MAASGPADAGGYLVQLLLPLYDNAGTRFPRSHFAEVREELIARFGGLTMFSRAPAEGLWKEPGEAAAHDDIVVYEVMTSELDREWWADWRRTLERRFAQDELIIRAHRVTRL